MNSRDRFLAALQGAIPDVVPVAPCYPDLFLERYQYQAYLDAYRGRLQDRSTCDLCPEEDNAILLASRLKALAAWHEMPDWLEVAPGPPAEVQARSRIERRDGALFLVDRHTGERLNLSLAAAGETNELLRDSLEALASCPVLSEDQIERLVPIPSKDELLASGRFDVARQMAGRFRGQLFVHSIVSTPFLRVQYVTGFVNLMIMMKTDKALLHRLLDRFLRAQLEVLAVWAAVGVDGIWLQETYSSADLISPQCYDEFVYPTTRLLVQHCQALGLKALLYPCGDVVPRLPRLIEMAPDALAVEESKKSFVLDIGQIRRIVGDGLCLFGNVDAYGVLEQAGDEQLDAEIVRQLAAGRAARGAFILGIGSPITPGTPLGRVGHFIRRCRSLGRYPLGLAGEVRP